MTIAGVPVTVDSTGLHLQGQTVPNPLPQQAVNEAIKALGLQVVVTEPRTTTKGGAVSYDAGALVLLLTQGGTEYALTFGRASVELEATPAFAAPAVADTPVTPVAAAPAPPAVDAPAAEEPVEAPAVEAPITAVDTAPAPVADVPAAPEVAAPEAASPLDTLVPVSFPLAGGVPTLLALVGLAAVGFLAAGLRRMPDRVLALPAVECDERSS